MNPGAVCLVLLFVVVAALIALAVWCSPEPPKVKSHDAIDEEIRAERIELHNTSLDYAELQLKGAPDPLPHFLVAAMLSSAFKSGGRWQQRRDAAPPPEPKRRPECDHERCHVVEGEPGGPYRWSCGRVEG